MHRNQPTHKVIVSYPDGTCFVVGHYYSDRAARIAFSKAFAMRGHQGKVQLIDLTTRRSVYVRTKPHRKGATA